MRAKRAGKFFKLNCRKRSERKILGKFCTFPLNSSKLRSDYLFSLQKRTNYLFPAFSRSEYLFPKSASPPPPPPSESNGRPLSSVNFVDKYKINYSSFFYTIKGFRNVSSFPLADENSVFYSSRVCSHDILHF